MLTNIDLQMFAEEEGFDAMSNFTDWVSEGEEIEEDTSIADEQEDEEVEEAEEELEETEEIQDVEDKEIKKDVKSNPKQQQKRPLTKQEHALIQLKKQNKALKESFEQRLMALENRESERNYDVKKKELINAYTSKGYDEDLAIELAEEKIEKEKLRNEITSFKSELEALKNGVQYQHDIKTQAEQSILYKQAKAQKSKVDTLSQSKPTGSPIKMTSEQKRVWGMIQNAAQKGQSWAQGIKLQEWLKDWDK